LGNKRTDYRGYEIWEWAEGEKTPERVYSAVSKDKRPEAAGYMRTVDAVKKLIDNELDKPPEKVETYKGIDIYYIGKDAMYQAKIGNRTGKRKNVEQIHNLIDRLKKD
jgi:hypothetical protein